MKVEEIYIPKNSLKDSNKQFQYLRIDDVKYSESECYFGKCLCSLSDDGISWKEWIKLIDVYFIENNYELYTIEDSNRLLRIEE